MSEQQRETRQAGGAVLDLAARWFRARAGLSRNAEAAEHGHWNPASRTWRYHVHRRDRGSRRA
jgi:hypothetical protein